MFTLPTEPPLRARSSRGNAIHYSINGTIGNYCDWWISRVLLPKLVKGTNTIHLLAVNCQYDDTVVPPSCHNITGLTYHLSVRPSSKWTNATLDSSIFAAPHSTVWSPTSSCLPTLDSDNLLPVDSLQKRYSANIRVCTCYTMNAAVAC